MSLLLLRGSVTIFLSVGVFHQLAPPGPNKGTLGRFRFWPKIGVDIRQKVGSAVYDTPRNGDSVVYHTPWNGDSAVYLTPHSCTNTSFVFLCVRYTAE